MLPSHLLSLIDMSDCSLCKQTDVSKLIYGFPSSNTAFGIAFLALIIMSDIDIDIRGAHHRQQHHINYFDSQLQQSCHKLFLLLILLGSLKCDNQPIFWTWAT